MKFEIECQECKFPHDGGAPSEPHKEWLTIDDSGWFELNCPRGHSNVVTLQNMKFELLFETGAYALLDGYPREAVATFSAALERYYEFHLTVLAIYKDLSTESFERAWKLVAKQSERQLGAYLLSHAFEFGALPPTLPSKPDDWQKFRNDVVHNGQVPTAERATAYGDAVLKVIREATARLRTLETQKSDLFPRAFLLDMNRRRPKRFHDLHPSSVVLVGTIVMPTMKTPSDHDLTTALRSLRMSRCLGLNNLDPDPHRPAAPIGQ